MNKFSWDKAIEVVSSEANKSITSKLHKLFNSAASIKNRQSKTVENSMFFTLMKVENNNLDEGLAELRDQLKSLFKNGLHSDESKQIMSDWTDHFGHFKLVFTEEGFDFSYANHKEEDQIRLEFIKMIMGNSVYHDFFHKIRICKSCNKAYFDSSRPDFCSRKCNDKYHKEKDIESGSNKTRMGKEK